MDIFVVHPSHSALPAPPCLYPSSLPIVSTDRWPAFLGLKCQRMTRATRLTRALPFPAFHTRLTGHGMARSASQPHSSQSSLAWAYGRTGGPVGNSVSQSGAHDKCDCCLFHLYRCKGSSPPRPPPCLGILRGWRGRGAGEARLCVVVVEKSPAAGVLHVMETRKGRRGGGYLISPGLLCVVCLMWRVVVVMQWWLDGF